MGDYWLDFGPAEKFVKTQEQKDAEKQKQWDDYPKEAAQKLFNKLEIDLINNSDNVIKMLRVLHYYYSFVEELLKKTPNFMVKERTKLRNLWQRMATEMRILSQIDIKVGDFKDPVFFDELLVNDEDKRINWKDSEINYLLTHISNGGRDFNRQYKFYDSDIKTFSIKGQRVALDRLREIDIQKEQGVF